VLQAFRAKDAVLLRADITEANEPAEALLDSLGNMAHAIPYLAVFPGDKPNEPRDLTEFNPINPGAYRTRLFKILEECPDPPGVHTAQVR
jgi:hypothetical protein